MDVSVLVIREQVGKPSTLKKSQEAWTVNNSTMVTAR